MSYLIERAQSFVAVASPMMLVVYAIVAVCGLRRHGLLRTLIGAAAVFGLYLYSPMVFVIAQPCVIILCLGALLPLGGGGAVRKPEGPREKPYGAPEVFDWSEQPYGAHRDGYEPWADPKNPIRWERW